MRKNQRIYRNFFVLFEILQIFLVFFDWLKQSSSARKAAHMVSLVVEEEAVVVSG